MLLLSLVLLLSWLAVVYLVDVESDYRQYGKNAFALTLFEEPIVENGDSICDEDHCFENAVD